MLLWQPNKVAKLAFFADNLHCRTAIPKPIGISVRWWELKSSLNVATFCTNLVRFGAITLEKLLLILYMCEKNSKTWRVWPIISEGAQPILTKFSALIDVWVDMINLTFVLRLFKERCYDNQLIWDAFCKWWN